MSAGGVEGRAIGTSGRLMSPQAARRVESGRLGERDLHHAPARGLVRAATLVEPHPSGALEPLADLRPLGDAALEEVGAAQGKARDLDLARAVTLQCPPPLRQELRPRLARDRG